MVFLLIMIGMPILDGVWWWWADRRVRRLPGARWWRAGVAAFAGFQLAYLLGLMASRTLGMPRLDSRWLLALFFVWHLIVLPLTMLLSLPSGLWRDARRLWRWLSGAGGQTIEPLRDQREAAGWSRREILAVAATAAPPLATLAITGVGLQQLNHFRLSEIDLRLPQLPRELEGLVLAHVSDSHVGRFTQGKMLQRIVAAVNGLDADLILFTGDLINDSLSDLPSAVDMLLGMKARHGLFAIEGNHDLFESRFEFENTLRQSGIRLLLDESQTIRVRGQDVQLLGIQWGLARSPFRGAYDYHVARVLPMLRRDAFPILLSHHPDAFDPAREGGIPLTLSGHTHGGQLMLSENLGPGPLMFKYWSGLYYRDQAATIVSNGVGNWLPLRLNAPAEIARITLRRP